MKEKRGLLAVLAAIAANALWGSSFMASKVVLAGSRRSPLEIVAILSR